MAMARAMTQAESTDAGPSFDRHGGRLDDAARAYPGTPLPWLDLSTGINPVPWRAPADLAIDAAPLPTSASLRALEAAAARHFGVPAAHVAAVPGSEVALRLLPVLGLPSPIVAPVPSYASHAAVSDRRVDRSGIVDWRGGTLLIASPNNPDGWSPAASEVLALAARQRERGGWLVVDEAFVDAAPASSVLHGWDATLPLVVTRSFGKFFGLAGVRLGFVVAGEAVIARVRHLLGDWPVSAQAIAWGSAAYADRAWIAATQGALADRAARLDAVLAAHGLTATGDCPLFRLVTHRDARGIFARLAKAGILTRPFADRADWLRFGLPADAAALARLDRALGDG
jgi:cobalamin biosynthetic protein CobC